MEIQSSCTTGAEDASGPSAVLDPVLIWERDVALALQTQAVRNVEHGIVFVNDTDAKAQVNPVAARLLGMPAGVCDAREFHAALEDLRCHAVNADDLAGPLADILTDPESRISKWLWHLADPSAHVHLSVAPLYAGALRGRVWVFYDVSELFDAMEQIRTLEHRLRQLLTEGDVIAFRLRRGGTFDWVSQSTVRMLGYPEDTYLGKNATEFCHPGDVSMFYETVKHLRLTGRPQNIGIRVSDSSGRLRSLEGRVFLAHDDHESLEVILSDITSHVELERMRATVASVASHEMKTPLAFVTTGLAMLEDGTVDASSDEGREVVDRMRSAALRLAKMSDDLLGLQKLEITRTAIAHKSIPIHASVERAAGMVSTTRGIVVKTRDSSENSERYVDDDLLHQAVINLVDNAIRHSPDDGVVDVEVEVDGEDVTITVSDQGTGIPVESRGKIFQPFVRLDGDRRGAGLGLAIVDRIAKVHHGSVSVRDADVGTGSTFVLILKDLGERA